MKRDQVLNEEERRIRFSEKKSHDEAEITLNESHNVEEYDIIDENNQSSEDEPNFCDFKSESFVDVEKFHEDLSEHCSFLDPETGLIQGIHEETEVEKSPKSSFRYFHKKFQREFTFQDDTQFEVKKVKVIDDSEGSPMVEENEKVLEVEVDVINFETITFSFSTRELKDLYTQEECNYFQNALSFFKSAVHHTSSMKVTGMDMALLFAQSPTNLPPEYFMNAQNFTRLDQFYKQ